MLSREEAAARLKAFRAPLQDPPADFRGPWPIPVEQLLQLWQFGRLRLQPHTVGEALDQLAPDRLLGALESVHPALGSELARWWSRSAAQPAAGLRHAPRLPHRPARGHHATRAYDLSRLLRLAADYPQDVGWFATWAGHVSDHEPELAAVLAGEIDAGRADLAETLTASVEGRHVISGPSDVALRALLATSEPTNWRPVTDLLRSAGRQDGVRTAILAATDTATPGALTAVVNTLVDAGMVRFSSVLAVLGGWLEETLTPRETTAATAVLEVFARTLTAPDPSDPGHGGARTPAEHWAFLSGLAVHDRRTAIPPAVSLLGSTDPRLRLAGIRFLRAVPGEIEGAALALQDPDQAVFAVAAATVTHGGTPPGLIDDDRRSALLDRMRTMPRRQRVQTGLLGDRLLDTGSAAAADVLLHHDATGSQARQVWAAASPSGRARIVRRLGEDPEAHRDALFGHLADRAGEVRNAAHLALRTLTAITPTEAAHLHDLLRRRGDDVSGIAVDLLRRQEPAQQQYSIATLAGGTATQVRVAAQLARACGLPDPTLPAAPSAAIGRTADDLLAGLRFTPGDRTPAVRPEAPPEGTFRRYHAGCRAIVASLQALLAGHGDTEVASGEQVVLLQNLSSVPDPPQGSAVPLPELLAAWWSELSPALTDGGIEFALLSAVLSPGADRSASWYRGCATRVIGDLPADAVDHPFLRGTVSQMAHIHRRPSWPSVLLDVTATFLAALPLAGVVGPPATMARLGRALTPREQGPPVTVADCRYRVPGAGGSGLARPDHHELLERWWSMARFLDEPEGTTDAFATTAADAPHRHRPVLRDVCAAFDAGLATRADLLDALLQPGHQQGRWSLRPALVHFSARRPEQWGASPAVQQVVDDVRRAAIDAQLVRGELDNALTPVAAALQSATGITSVVRLLEAMAGRAFDPEHRWVQNRDALLTQLIQAHVPAEGDSGADLRDALRSAAIPSRRAVEFAVLAPQWASLVEEALERPGLASAVWWVQAHTRDHSWGVDRTTRSEWSREIARLTPVEESALYDGAVDVDWYQRTVAELGRAHFAEVLGAAKLATRRNGHVRLRFLARALGARADQGSVAELEAELTAAVVDKRSQDAARALGLLPLDGPADPRVLGRWQVLQRLAVPERGAKTRKRASEAAAVAVGSGNLARVAGYPDANRLTWAMEAEALGDLADGPVTVLHGDVTVTLSIDGTGMPDLAVHRGERALAKVPRDVARDPATAELVGRGAELRASAVRMRRALERACTTGEQFPGEELGGLLHHPVLAPMLRDLVLVDDVGALGFPAPDGSGLRAGDGRLVPWAGRRLRVAHPVDLARSGRWSELQRELFDRQRKQPFRQLFRELHLPTESELDQRSTRRFQGHQVVRRQAAALLGARGWFANQEAGAYERPFAEVGVVASCPVGELWEFDDRAGDPEVGELIFSDARHGRDLLMRDVPPRVFSEALRDLDLAVSVASAAGVDPEPSVSTVEVRRRLVEETARMLALTNVTVTAHHVLIEGAQARYSVHLGSGTVHRMPGHAVFLVPVGDQHRGRMFLPFVEDDPRIAEILAKVLLLADDQQISDPTLLAQLR